MLNKKNNFINLINELFKIIKIEQNILCQSNFDIEELNSTVCKKQILFEKIQKEQNAKQTIEITQEEKERIKNIQKANQINGQILQTRQAYIQNLLSILRPNNPTKVYNKTGLSNEGKNNNYGEA